MRVGGPSARLRASRMRCATTTPDSFWGPKSRSRTRFSTCISSTIRIASSGVEALRRSAEGQRSLTQALIWAIASGESSAMRRRSDSSGLRSRLLIALCLLYRDRAGRGDAPRHVLGLRCPGWRQPNDHRRAPARRRRVFDARADLLGAAPHERHARVLAERTPVRRAVVLDANLDRLGVRRLHGDADERAARMLAGIVDRLEHDAIQQDQVRVVPDAPLDGGIRDAGRPIERDLAALAAPLEVRLRVGEPLADRRQKSVRLEVARIEVVHDAAQFLGERLEPAARFHVVLLVDRRRQVSGQRVEDLVMDLLADPDRLRLDVLEQLAAPSFEHLYLLLELLHVVDQAVHRDAERDLE